MSTVSFLLYRLSWSVFERTFIGTTAISLTTHVSFSNYSNPSFFAGADPEGRSVGFGRNPSNPTHSKPVFFVSIILGLQSQCVRGLFVIYQESWRMGQIYPSFGRSGTIKFSASGFWPSWVPDQDLCPLTTLGAKPQTPALPIFSPKRSLFYNPGSAHVTCIVVS